MSNIVFDFGTMSGKSASEYISKYISNALDCDSFKVSSLSSNLEEYMKTGSPIALQDFEIGSADNIAFVIPITYNSANGIFKLFVDSLMFNELKDKNALVIAVGGSDRSTYAAELSVFPILRNLGMHVYRDFFFIKHQEVDKLVGKSIVSERLDSLLKRFLEHGK